MSDIHPTAVIGTGAVLGRGVTIGPFAVVGGGAVVGDGTWIGSHAVVGAPPEVRSVEHGPGWLDDAECRVVIGRDVVLREAAQVHGGWQDVTRVGDGAFLMNQVYVAHDCQLAEGVTLASGVALAGHVELGRGANLGLNVSVHQRRRVGALAMVGMGAVVTRDVPPFTVSLGAPARVRRANAVGLERAGLPPEAVAWVTRWVERGARADDVADAPSDVAELAQWSGGA